MAAFVLTTPIVDCILRLGPMFAELKIGRLKLELIIPTYIQPT